MNDVSASTAGITVEELLDQTLTVLFNRWPRSHELSMQPVSVETAHDLQGQRTSTGHFIYNRVDIITLPDGRILILGRGTKDTNNPGESVRGDLIGILIPAGSKTDGASIATLLSEAATNFRHTLVLAHMSGNLAGTKRGLSSRIFSRMSARRDHWVSREYAVAQDVTTLGADVVYEATVLYKPDAALQLAEIIAEEIVQE